MTSLFQEHWKAISRATGILLLLASVLLLTPIGYPLKLGLYLAFGHLNWWWALWFCTVPVLLFGGFAYLAAGVLVLIDPRGAATGLPWPLGTRGTEHQRLTALLVLLAVALDSFFLVGLFSMQWPPK